MSSNELIEAIDTTMARHAPPTQNPPPKRLSQLRARETRLSKQGREMRQQDD